MKVYIAGPITGVPDYRMIFEEAASFLETEMGYVALNPAILPEGMDTEDYMAIGMAMLSRADAIFLLHGWENSGGAKVEKAYAEYNAKTVIYQELDLDWKEWEARETAANCEGEW